MLRIARRDMMASVTAFLNCLERAHTRRAERGSSQRSRLELRQTQKGAKRAEGVRGRSPDGAKAVS